MDQVLNPRIVSSQYSHFCGWGASKVWEKLGYRMTGGILTSWKSRTETYPLPDGRVLTCTNSTTAGMVHSEFTDGTYADCVARLRPGDTVIDIGAHVGLISLLLADSIDASRIIGCEPAPPSFECLERNFAHHVSGGTPVNAAVGSESGSVTLTYYPNSEVMSTIHVD